MLRSRLWRTAAGTGAGAALVCAILGIVAVAICWLPVSGGSSGRAHSAISAGLLTYLAALHGGVTVDGTFASWVPLGMTLIAALVCRRAGRTLGAIAAQSKDAADSRDLLYTLLVQAGGFAVVAVLAVPFAGLGTSGASYGRVLFAGLVLFLLCAGVPFARATALGDELRAASPGWLAPSVRAAAAGLSAYLGAGAVLVAFSLLLHHDRVGALAAQVGGGWGTVPVLLLCVLAAPNAAVAGAGYLAGPGFAVGDTVASVSSSAHGVLPAFPLLGAVPSGPANPVVWVAMVLTGLGAGAAVATVVLRREPIPLSSPMPWWRPFASAAAAAATAGVLGLLLAWLCGGGIGSGALGTIGVPPGWFALALAGLLLAGSCIGLVVAAAWRAVRLTRIDRAETDLAFELPAVELAAAAADADADGSDGRDTQPTLEVITGGEPPQDDSDSDDSDGAGGKRLAV